MAAHREGGRDGGIRRDVGVGWEEEERRERGKGVINPLTHGSRV